MQTDKLYEFSEDRNTCRILNPRTPRYWYNYLWSEQGYCMQISQVGHGKSEYIDEKSDMCRVNNRSARYFYLRDDDENIFWNIGVAPLNEAVEDYICEHSIGYSKISSRKAGIRASIRYHVPTDGYREVWTVEMTNESDRIRNISTFAAISFDLDGFKYPRYYEMYRSFTTEYRESIKGIYAESHHPFAPHSRYNGYIVSDERPFAYDGNLAEFCGPISTLTEADTSATALFQRPDTVCLGQDCHNSECALFIMGGVLQHKHTLSPGETKTFHIIVGLSESVEEVEEILKESDFEREFTSSEQAYYDKYSSLSIETPDKLINDRMNNWVKKQVDFCIVGKKGVRDNLQIAVALLNYRPDKAKSEILECLRHQFRDGHAVLTWYPYDDTRYSDQPFWIIWAACELLKETGDFSLLNTELEWQDGGSDSLYEHLKAAVNCLVENSGAHGLPKILYADWNDALNITTDPEAESVMLAEQFCLALREFIRLIDYLENNADDSARVNVSIKELTAYKLYLTDIRERLAGNINKYAWDGAWYCRALSNKGNIGSSACNDGKIYVNAQTWAVLADIVPEDRLPVLLESLDAMEQDFGYPICDPPYSDYDASTGRMSGMLPGLFENGAVYCHATGFKVLMDGRIGRGEDAVRTLKKIIPDSPYNSSSRSGAEPYVFTNCYASHPLYYGKSYGSWTTGTSAWCLRGILESVLGIRRDYDGLHVDPTLPEDWEDFTVIRTFRGKKYRIKMP